MALRGVHLNPDRSTSSAEKLVDLLYRDEHIPANRHRSHQEAITKKAGSNAAVEAADGNRE